MRRTAVSTPAPPPTPACAAGPGTDWRRIAVLPAGTNIRLDGQAPGGGWVRGVTQNNQQGWVVDTSLNLSADQLAALPSKWVDDPVHGLRAARRRSACRKSTCRSTAC